MRPLSTSIETNCVANSGLPSDVATTLAAMASSTVPPRSTSTRRSVCGASRAGTVIPRTSTRSAHCGRLSSSPRRPVAMTRTADWGAVVSSTVFEQVEERRLGVVDVLDAHDDRPPGAQRLQEAPGSPEDLTDRKALRREPDYRADPIADVGTSVHAFKHRPELSERDLGRVLIDDPGRRPSDLDERPERDAVAVRQAPALEHGGRLTDLALEGLEQERLAHPGFAEERRQPGAAVAGDVSELPAQLLELLVAPDELSARRRRPFRSRASP